MHCKSCTLLHHANRPHFFEHCIAIFDDLFRWDIQARLSDRTLKEVAGMTRCWATQQPMRWCTRSPLLFIVGTGKQDNLGRSYSIGKMHGERNDASPANMAIRKFTVESDAMSPPPALPTRRRRPATECPQRRSRFGPGCRRSAISRAGEPAERLSLPADLSRAYHL